MPTSINGWTVLDNPAWDDSRLTRLKVPGTPCVFYGRASVAPLFVALALDYHKTIHPLTGSGDVDAYDYRQARAAASWSDHSSGTAMDIRASAEGAQGNGNYAWWQGAKAAQARRLLAKYEIIMWGGPKNLGGSYGNPVYYDYMHWALKPGTTQADVDRVLKRLRIRPDGTVSPLGKIANVVAPKLSAHQLHLLHLKNTGKPSPKPAKPALTAHQLHMQHLANTAQPAPVVAASGPDWLIKFLRAHKVPNERAWFAVIMRESGGQSDCMYPAGAPWGDWKHGNGRHFDTGLCQLNDRHVEDAAALGYGPDMRWALDPNKNLDYALKHLSWSDWGLEITSDAAGNATGYKFNWSGWPSPYQPGQSGAVSAEAGFKEWWDAYPTYAAKVV
jgi:hypothetical protein